MADPYRYPPGGWHYAAYPTTAPPAPAPVPPGPGVRPPFAAAPVEGRTARLWISLGVAGALVALCCGVGIAAVVGLALTSMQAVTEQSQRAVDDYLSARVEGDWQEAYELRCEADQQAESLGRYTDRVSAEPRIESYELGEVEVTPRGDLRLSAVVDYDDGTSERLLVPLEQDPETGQMQVCGFDR
jgi:hypothetical protein